MARTVITPDKAKEINELYYVLKNKSAVARQMGISPATVSRYLVQGYVPESELIITPVDLDKIHEKVEGFLLTQEDFSNETILELTEDEMKDMELLWKEISI